MNLKRLLSLLMAAALAFGLVAPGVSVYADELGDASVVAPVSESDGNTVPDGGNAGSEEDPGKVEAGGSESDVLTGSSTVSGLGTIGAIEPKALISTYTYTLYANYPEGSTPVGENPNPTILSKVKGSLPLAEYRTWYSCKEYTLTGWNTAADGSGTGYAVDAYATGNMDLYAQWADNSSVEPPREKMPAKPTKDRLDTAQFRFYSNNSDDSDITPKNHSLSQAAGYTIGEVEGNDWVGYTCKITVTLAHGDAMEAAADKSADTSWRQGTWIYDFSKMSNPFTFTAYYITGKGWSAYETTYQSKFGTVSYNEVKIYITDQQPAATYTVTYTDGVGGTAFKDVTYTVEEGKATPAFGDANPTRSGYVFTGWDPEVAETVTADATYTATWAKTYTVTLDPNGGVPEVEPITVTLGEPYGELPQVSRTNYDFGGWALEDGTVVTADTLVSIAGDHTLKAVWTVAQPKAPGSSTTNTSKTLFTIQCDSVEEHKHVSNWFGSHVTYVKDSLTWDADRGVWTCQAKVNLSVWNLPSTLKKYFGGISHHYDAASGYTQYPIINLVWDPDVTGENSQGNEVTGLWVGDGEQTVHWYCYTLPAAPSAATVEKLNNIIWVHENGQFPDGPKATSKYITSRKLIAGTYTVGEMYQKDGAFYCDLTITDLAPYVKAYTDKYGEAYHIDTIHSYAEYKYVLKYTGSTTDYKQDGTGWTVDASSYANNSEKSNGKSLWMTDKCIVTYTDGVDGETIFEDQTTVVAYGAETPAFEGDTPTREHYSFTGWEPEVAGTVTGDVTYTAKWKADEYKVTLNSNGGTALDPITVTYGSKYGNYNGNEKLTDLPSAGYIDGFQNQGWYIVNADGTLSENSVNKRTAVTVFANHTLFQQRAIKDPAVKVEVDTPSENIPPKYGYYYKPDSRRVLTVSFTKEYNDQQLVYTYQWYKDGELIEGAAEPVLNLEGNVSDSGEYVCVVTAVKADGCTIVTTNESAETTVSIQVAIRKASNTIEYDPNGGVGGPVNNFSNANYATVQSKQPTRTGYTFAGWNTAADGSGDAYQGGDKYTFEGDTGNGGEKVMLYAQWTANVYQVTFDAKGGKVSPGSMDVTYDKAVGKLPTPTRADYVFLGWYDADGNEVTAETVYTTAGDSTYTAKWVNETCTITLRPNGGEVSPTTLTATYGKAIGKLPTPTREDYVFRGWYDASGKQVTEKTIVTGNMTLTAYWAEKDPIPKTGDSSMPLVFAALMLASMAGIAVAAFKKKRA